MPDREKYIEVLSKAAKTVKEFNEDIPIKISLESIEDILELLKEQEAVEPKVIRMNDFGHPVHACGKCGHSITESMNYCHECGKRIDWESR